MTAPNYFLESQFDVVIQALEKQQHETGGIWAKPSLLGPGRRRREGESAKEIAGTHSGGHQESRLTQGRETAWWGD